MKERVNLSTPSYLFLPRGDHTVTMKGMLREVTSPSLCCHGVFDAETLNSAVLRTLKCSRMKRADTE